MTARSVLPAAYPVYVVYCLGEGHVGYPVLVLARG